ncbi:MAG: hypothetical protein HDS79_03855 [Bacteroidales bacterium]|nr:hypothetical protein [Bacteroidales bacterium]MDE7465154.1 hypothetical protein [Muribaculaceae bacterium]
MNKKIIISICLALCALCAQGQTAFSADSMNLPSEIAEADTLHVTPAMIDSIVKKKTLEEYRREMESVVFVPKGQWLTGVSISYSQSNQNKYQFLILDGVSGDTYTFKVTPMLGYMIADDMGLGLKFGYQRSLTKLEEASIVLDTDMDYSMDHIYSLAHNYYATMFFRNYFSIGRSKRFGFFNEVQCQLGGGQSKFTTGVGDNITGTYEKNFQLSVGIVPGLCMFLNNYSALEVNIGVLGFSYTSTKSTTDRIYVSRRKSKLANFHINLFSITFGMSFYL